MRGMGLYRQEDGTLDIEITEQGIRLDEGMETISYVSMYSDGLASPDDVYEGVIDLKGFWGDMFPDVPNDKFGSLLWTTERHKASRDEIADINDKTKSAFAWMVRDGIAGSVKTITTREGIDDIKSVVDIRHPGKDIDTRFSVLWDKQFIKG